MLQIYLKIQRCVMYTYKCNVVSTVHFQCYRYLFQMQYFVIYTFHFQCYRYLFQMAYCVMYTFHATDILSKCNVVSNVHFPCCGCPVQMLLVIIHFSCYGCLVQCNVNQPAFADVRFHLSLCFIPSK